MLDKAQTCDFLDRAGVEYRAIEHSAVYTIDEMDTLGLDPADMDCVVKNLFLRDDKKRAYYLVCLPGHKQANLKALREVIGSRPLGFASETELYDLLGLEKGHVTPLGLLNDPAHKVQAIFDRALCGSIVGVHPNDNTASVFMRFEDLVSVLERTGHACLLVDMI